jgi:hypothetical protein
MKNAMILTMSVILISALYASADTIILKPDGAASKDAYTSGLNPDTNYGNEAYMSLGYDGSYYYYTYIDFEELDNDSGATINSAVLSIFAISGWGIPNTYMLIGMADAPWSESTITNNNAPYMETEPRTSFLAPSEGQWRATNVTEIVTEWLNGDYPNDGFAIFKANDSNGEVNLYSGEYSDPTYRPYLYLDYTPATGIKSTSVGGIKVAFK